MKALFHLPPVLLTSPITFTMVFFRAFTYADVDTSALWTSLQLAFLS